MKHWIVGAIGMTEQGKTYWCEKNLLSNRRLIIADPKSAFMKNVLIKDNLSDAINSTFQKDEFRIACRFDNIEDYEALFHAIDYDYENTTLVVDEISMWENSAKSNPNLRRIAQISGSKTGNDLIWNCQRPRGVSNDVESQSLIIICFRVQKPSDLMTMSSNRLTRADIEKISEQKVGEFTQIWGDESMMKRFRHAMKSKHKR